MVDSTVAMMAEKMDLMMAELKDEKMVDRLEKMMAEKMDLMMAVLKVEK